MRRQHGGGSPAGGSERGFSLIEAVVAAGLIAGACAALAQMLAMSIDRNLSARSLSSATVMAAKKMEELRSLPWGAATGVDYVDQSGRIVGSGGAGPPESAYARHWDIEPFAPGADVLACRVVVTRAGREQAHLSTLRTRRSP